MPKIENLTDDITKDCKFTELRFKDLLLEAFLIGLAVVVALCAFFIPFIKILPYLCR